MTEPDTTDPNPTDTRTAYQRLGGAAGIRPVVDAFYVHVLGDDVLAPYFAGRNMAAIKLHMVGLLAWATGGPDPYRGRDLADAHTDLPAITDDAFTRVRDHLELTLLGAGVPADITDTIRGYVEAQRGTLVGTGQG